MANSRKKISELPALSVASLDTTFVLGISGSTTYKISINNLTSSLDTTFATDLVTNALSSSLSGKLSTSSFNSYTQSFTASVASGTISGSSQLTSSFDTRYVVSGSITQTTWDNIANKPAGIVSQSTDLSSLNTFTASISTASLVTSISNLNTFTASVSTASLVTSISNLNTFTSSQSTSSLVNRLNAIESVSGSWITESETGSFLTSLSGAISSSTQISDLGFVTGSYTTINSFNSLTQSFNSISQSFNVISGSVGTVDFNGVVSGSSQLTSSYDTRYVISGSVGATPSGTISGSAQITAFGFVSGSYETTGRGIISSSANLVTTSSFNSYTASISTASLVTSISNLNTFTASVTTASIVTSISNLNTFTASVTTASIVTSISNLNTFTASVSTASLVTSISNLNSFTASQSTASLVTSISNLNSTTSSLNISVNALNTATSSYETKGRGLVSGSSQITYASISSIPAGIVSGSSQTIANLPTGVVSGSSQTILNLPTGVVSGSSQLTSSYDGRYTQTGSFNTYTSSINSWTSSFSSSLTSSITSVSGTFTNLTVNGQPTTYGVVNPDFINAGRITSDQSGLGANSDIIFNAWVYKNGVSLDTTTGVFTLTANKTYRLFSELSFANFSDVTNGYVIYNWVDATTNTKLDTSGISVGVGENINRNTNEFNATSTTLIYTPTTNQTIKVRITEAVGTVTVRSAIGTKAIIEQINPTIAVQSTATGTVAATIITDTNVVGTSINGGSNTSPALTILTLAIPSAGTWRLDAELRVYVPGAGYMAAAFYNNGTLIPGSEYFVAAGGVTQSGAATGQYSGFMSYDLTTTSARTVTVGIWSTTSANAIDSGDGRTWARATKIDSTFALNALDTMQISNSLAVTGSTTLRGAVAIGTGSGVEGGEINLAYAQTTSLTGSALNFDVYQDRLRIFEGGGNNRGAYLNVASQSNSVGSEILTTTSTRILATPAWTSAGAITLTATTTNPTKGVTAQDNISYRQLGAKEWEIVMTYNQSANTGYVQGSGDYLITLPNGLSFDTTLPSQQIYTSNVGTNTWAHNAYIIPNGNGLITNTSVGGHIYPMVYSATKFRILTITYGSGILCWGSGFYSTIDIPKIQLSFRFTST